MNFPKNAFDLHVAHQRALKDKSFQAFMAKALSPKPCPPGRSKGAAQ